MIILIFLLIGAFFIINNYDLALSKKENLDKFYSLYYSWFGELFNNAKSITGYIAKSKWLPYANKTSS